MLLTPHATNAQNREMKRLKSTPPIRMINIGKTYRPNWDVTHTPMFHQFDGVCIDKNMNITQLKGTLDYFVKTFLDRSAQLVSVLMTSDLQNLHSRSMFPVVFVWERAANTVRQAGLNLVALE
ncbi:hypothetical protein IPH70_02075 [Candidatus Roizmanbacteria bacterium]|nr:MAG: hypothetical protein IPH70_02075 [Candidatus Roizmanbacteria bacterium]